jgi:nucleoside-diphosphate-sugar epimerase
MSRRGTVLVTGASGFVGRGVVPYLADQGWQVRAAARHVAAVPAGPGIEVVTSPELSSPDIDWTPLVDGVTHVAHLAGLAHMMAEVPESTFTAINATATARLAVASRIAGVKRMVLVSSIRAAIGAVATRVIKESDEPAPDDAYGRSKLAAEIEMRKVLEGGTTEGVVLRPVLVYGPNVRGNMAAMNKLARLPVPLPLGGLRNRRSVVSLGNLSSAIQHALTSPNVAGGTYLVSDGPPVSVAQMIEWLRQGLGRGPGLVSIPLGGLRMVLRASGRSGMWDRIAGDLVADISALKATGWLPPETTAQALAAAIRSDS